MLLLRRTQLLLFRRPIPDAPARFTWLSAIHTGCPKRPWPRMASALVDTNRLPLSRTAAALPGLFVRLTLAPCSPPLMLGSVIEMGVLLAKMPSVLVETTVLCETTRPKLNEP